VADDDMIFDVGPKSAADLRGALRKAGTIVWNGPVGVFEFDQFAAGTKALGEAIAESDAFSIAGGGDTLAAIDKYGLANASPIFPPAAVPSWSSLKARHCPPWPCWKNGPRADADPEGRMCARPCHRRVSRGGRT
jgi:hypothetical protein